MRFEKSSLLVALGVGAVGIVTTAAGCELIASADRSKISATGGTGGDATGGGGAGGGTGGAAGGMGGAGGGMGGAGGGPECTVPADCGPTGSPCVEATCTDGVCGTQNTAPGTPLPAPDQTPGDCSTAVCDGNGNVAAMDDPNDVEDDTQSCTTDTCSMGNPVHTPVAVGTMCMDGGGTFCSVMGTCVECNSPADCTTGVCQNNACQAASCGDGVQNGDETDTDCGGSCGPCADGDACLIPADCQSGVCTATVCQMASCTDNVDNGNETDIDCGGGACPPCGPGEGCMMPTDCAGGSCLMSVCAETCTDGEQNNDETDIDCGGPNCLDCPNGGMCGLDTDCTSGFCNTDTGTCATPTCNDGYQNGTETGIDCGGPCLACPGATCTLNSDCASGMCYEGTCVASVNGCDINTATNLTGMATATVTFPNGNLTYAPKCIRVTLGTDVTFNGSFVNHPLQGGQVINMMEVSATTGPFVTVTNTGTTATFDMPAAVTYPYYCVPHGTLGMNGAIFVVP